MTDYTDFDGAQARVAAPNSTAENMSVVPIAQIEKVDLTRGEGGIALYTAGSSLFASCAKARELAEFIGKHMEYEYTAPGMQSVPMSTVND
jgi:hypothetical protein